MMIVELCDEKGWVKRIEMDKFPGDVFYWPIIPEDVLYDPHALRHSTAFEMPRAVFRYRGRGDDGSLIYREMRD